MCGTCAGEEKFILIKKILSFPLQEHLTKQALRGPRRHSRPQNSLIHLQMVCEFSGLLVDG